MADSDYDDDYEEEGDDGAYYEDTERIEQKPKKKGIAGLFNHLNEFMISTAAHAMILFIVSLIPVRQDEPPKKVKVVTTLEELPEEEEKEEIEKVEVEVEEVEVTETESESEEEVVTEVEVETDTMSEVEDEVEVESVVAGADDAADAPPAVIGAGGGPTGGGLPFGYKSRSKKGKKKALRKYKGSKATETAVEAALRWLQLHQEPLGYWDTFKYDGGNDRRAHIRHHHYRDRVSATAAAILAFLGAGYSERVGPPAYKRCVRKGIRWINQYLMKELRNGEFQLIGGGHGRGIGHRYTMYSRSVLLQCLSEASIFGSGGKTRYLANKLSDFFVKSYYKSGKNEAWGYHGSGFDLSLSGWVGLGLKGAKVAELEVFEDELTEHLLDDYRKWVATMTDPKTGMGVYYPKDQPRHSMTWVGMFQRQFLGYPRNDPFLTKAGVNLQTETPRLIGGEPEEPYEIYYATLSAFQQGGKTWATWNKYMKKCLISHQRKGKTRILGGSWDPRNDEVSGHGGRVLVTALYALCLEVYYRYEQFN